MRSNILLSILCLILCLVLCLGSAACRSTAADDAESVGLSEVLEIEDCVLSLPYVLVTPEMLDTLPEALRNEAKKCCGKSGTVVVASSLRPRYFRLIRSQQRLVLGSVDVNPVRQSVFLSVISGLGDVADCIRSIKIENPESPDPWDLGIFIRRYPDLADRIGGLPPGDARLDTLRPAARELLSRGSTKNMLERRAGTKDLAALEAAVRAEQEQIGVLEDILNSN